MGTEDATGATTAVTSVEQLRELVGEPARRAATKVRSTLDADCRAFIARSPFHVLATCSAAGEMDVSPKGDPAGQVLVTGERTLLIPDRPGNRRVDGFANVVENPRAGVLFLVPRRTDTLRVNGSARVLIDPPEASSMQVRSHVPQLVLEVTVEEAFFHCPKAFMRSGMWDPEAWPADDLPSVAEIAQRTSPETALAELEASYDTDRYRRILYDGSA